MKNGGGCFCLGSPMRALARACDSACDLYVRGISGCASHVPSGAVAGGRGPGFGRSATAMYVRASSDRADDLVRASSKQRRRVAPEPADVRAATKVRVGQEPAAAVLLRRKDAAMETIPEDAPCEFGACTLIRPAQRRRGAARRRVLAARSGGFGAIKVGSEALPRHA
ncbi:uncharacterized protein LOC124663048 [Lolium rigidum]|uniref:uncharacterized protein LOC124663048 n=1 Tax=Lolium rigidum TaxID=89674 RepID=UPI001F5D0B2B|nr:uncharacterized protein LOC124663048 [Lolium rigidum]